MPKRAFVAGAAFVVLGCVLAAASGYGAQSAGVLLWLAQLPMALGVALLRRSRSTHGLLADTGRLALRWGAAALAATVLLGGPLALLLAAPSLGHSLLLSGMRGGCWCCCGGSGRTGSIWKPAVA